MNPPLETYSDEVVVEEGYDWLDQIRLALNQLECSPVIYSRGQ